MFKGQKGMSLVSVMVSIGLTGVLAMILMNLMQQQGKQQKKAMVDGEMTEIYAQFVRVINQKTSCGATFIGLQKGDSFTEFRYTFDANDPPFAKVGDKFRGTQLVLTSMKILTDAESTGRGLPLSPEIVVLELNLTKPEGTLGAKTIKKTFDIPAMIGKGDIIKMADPNAVLARCTAISGDGCMADFDTGVCNTTNPQSAMINSGFYWFGYCFDPTPALPADNIIVRCTANN